MTNRHWGRAAPRRGAVAPEPHYSAASVWATRRPLNCRGQSCPRPSRGPALGASLAPQLPCPGPAWAAGSRGHQTLPAAGSRPWTRRPAPPLRRLTGGPRASRDGRAVGAPASELRGGTRMPGESVSTSAHTLSCVSRCSRCLSARRLQQPGPWREEAVAGWR